MLEVRWKIFVKYILDKYPEVDPDRAVAAGASYGGYAIKYVSWKSPSCI